MTPDGEPVLIDAKEIGQTLASYGVQAVVLNACDSARGDGKDEANLAKVFVQQGIKFVFAMSYKLMTSALSTLIGQFYRSLLEDKEDIWTAASSARQALRANNLRRARFGLDVEVNDWIVPVAYAAKDCDIRFKWQEVKESKQRVSKFPRFRSSPSTSTKTAPPPEPIGCDTLILRLETIFLTKSRPIQLFGKAASGKTYLAQFLRHWWLRTGLIDASVYVDFQGRGQLSPVEYCKQLLAAFDDARPSQPPHLLQKLKSLNIKDAKHYLDVRATLSQLENIISKDLPGLGGKRKLVILDNLELPALPDPAGSPELPSGWEEKYTVRGKPFYVDHNTKTTTWVCPAGTADREETELWTSLFQLLQKANCLILILSRDESHREDLNLVSIDLGSLSEYAAHELLAQDGGESKSLIKNRASDPEITKATEVLLRRLDLLPGPINLLRSVLVTQEAPGIEKIYSQGGDILMNNTKVYKELKSTKLYHTCASLFDHASEFEKALLLGLGLFFGTIPKTMEGFALHIMKWECYCSNDPLLKVLAKYECPCCRRKRWGSLITKLAVTDPDCEALDLDVWVPGLEKIPALKLSLLDAGLLTRTSFYMDEVESTLEVSPVFSIHPIFTLFLRRRLNLLSEEMIRNYKAAFVEYHEWRTLPLNAYTQFGVDLRNLNDKIERNLYYEISENKENYLAALNFALSSNLPTTFPYRILFSICSFGQTLVPTLTDIPDTTVAEYMTRAMQKLLDVSEAGGLTISKRTARRLAAIGSHGEFDKEDMVTVTRYFISYSLWLFRYYLKQSDIPSMKFQLQTSKNLVQQVDELFSAGEKVRESALDVERMDKFVRDGFQNTVQFWIGMDRADASDPPIVRAGALMLEIGDEAINLLQKIASLGVFREEDVQKMVKECNDSTLPKYRELAKLWPDVIEAAKTNEDFAFMLRMYGLQIEGSAIAAEEEDEEMRKLYSTVDQVPGMAIQQQQFQSLIEVITKIQEGASDEELLALSQAQSKQFLEDFKSKDFPLQGLEQAMQRGDLQQVILFNSLIMQQLDLGKDWQGLREHLHSIWKKERETPLDKLGKNELEILGYWWLTHAVCDLRLEDYKLCLQNLLNAFNIASQHTPDMDHLQFKTLVLIGKVKIEHSASLDPSRWPGWGALLHALVIAYIPDYEGIYARNGSLFTDIFRILQVSGRSELEEMKYLETFDASKMRDLMSEVKGKLSEKDRDKFSALQEMNEEFQASKEKLKALREGGASYLTPENLQKELDQACFLIGHIMEKKEPLSLAWFKELAARPGASTGEDFAVMEKAKTFLQEVDDQIAEVLENVGDRDDEDEERTREIQQMIDALMMTAEWAIFSKGE